MNIVKLPLGNKNPAARAVKALEISRWLQDEYGFKRETDYDWYFMSKDKEVHFRFYNNEEMSSFLLMKWVE